MGKKITELLKDGNPAKMYYLLYRNPMSIYEVSKIIYKKKKAQPQKLYMWRDKLKEKKYIKEIEKNQWQSTVTPLINEIQKRLKEKNINKLSLRQLNFLIDFLDNSFRKVVTLYETDIANVTNALEFLLTDLELYLIIYENIIFNKHPELKKKFRTMKDYDGWKNNLPRFKKEIERTIYNMTKKQYGFGKIINVDLLQDIFIPYEIIQLLKGISLYGEKFRKFTLYLQKTNNLVSKF